MTPRSKTYRFIRLSLLVSMLAASIGLSSLPAQAAQFHVPADFPTIQAAIDAAAPGDTVLVDPGTYGEALDFHQKDVRVESTGGPSVTTLAVPSTTGVTIGPGGAFVGFTVSGALASFGAAVEVSGTGTSILGNIFDGNTQSAGGFGAGIGGNNASPVVDGNVFRNNSCDDQFLSGVVAFVNGSSPRITNNLFLDNPCRAINMTLPEGTTPQVINNTIVGNSVGIRVDGRVNTVQQIYRNNIISGNGIGLQVDFGSEAHNPTWQSNLVFGNGTNYSGIADQTGIAGNISEDPAFVDPSRDDYHLRAGSLAIDTGSSLGAPTVDFDGSSRPQDGDLNGVAVVDIGAYEFLPTGVTTVAIDIKPNDKTNTIRLKTDRTVAVAILSTQGFDAPNAVVKTSLTFGRTGDEQSLSSCAAKRVDVNGDRLPDLVCQFVVRATGFRVGDTEGILRGLTTNGSRIEGRDSVRIVR